MIRQLLLLLIAVVGFCVVESLLYAARFLSERRQEELLRRLRTLGERNESHPALLKAQRLSESRLLADLLRPLAFASRMEKLLEQAGVGMTVARFLTYSLGSGAAGFTLGVIASPGFIAPFALAAAGLLLPLLLVYLARVRRSHKLSEQLPDALDMVCRSLKAGHSLASALRLVATEMPMPICLEFGRAFDEQSLGLPIEKTLLDITGRAPGNLDLKIFAVSVLLQKETGGNLVEILEKLADTIRARYAFQRKLRTLAAEGRLSALIIGALPIGMGLFLASTKPEYFSLLLTDTLGRAILAYAAMSWLLGMLWMRRIAKVEL